MYVVIYILILMIFPSIDLSHNRAGINKIFIISRDYVTKRICCEMKERFFEILTSHGVDGSWCGGWGWR